MDLLFWGLRWAQRIVIIDEARVKECMRGIDRVRMERLLVFLTRIGLHGIVDDAVWENWTAAII